MVCVKLQNYWQKYTLFFKQIHIKQKKDKKKAQYVYFLHKNTKKLKIFYLILN
jgi:hypothetical protein